jgi:DNA-binding NarL/FixJ family response regulator
MMTRYGTAVLADRHHPLLKGIHALLHEAFDAVVMVADDRSLAEVVARMSPDILIIDLSLPSSVDDLNVAHRFATERPNLKVIVLSVHDEPAAVRQTLAAGAAAFVLKRTAGIDLLAAVREVRAGRTFVSPDARLPADRAVGLS